MNVPETITLGEDAAVTYPMIEKANTISIINEYGYMYRVNNQSMTRSYNSKLSGNSIELIEYLRLWALGSEFSSIIIPQLQDYCCYIFMGVVANEILGSNNIELALDNIKKVAQNKLINESIHRKGKYNKTRIAYYMTKHKSLSLMLRCYWMKKAEHS